MLFLSPLAKRSRVIIPRDIKTRVSGSHNTRVLKSQHVCLEVKFGFKKKIERTKNLANSNPVRFSSLVGRQKDRHFPFLPTHPPTHLPTYNTYPFTYQPTYPSTHLPINPRTHQPTFPSTNLPINPPTHQPTYPFTYQPTYPLNPPTHQPTYPSTHLPIHLSTHLPINPPTHKSTYPFTYQPTYPSTHLPIYLRTPLFTWTPAHLDPCLTEGWIALFTFRTTGPWLVNDPSFLITIFFPAVTLTFCAVLAVNMPATQHHVRKLSHYCARKRPTVLENLTNVQNQNMLTKAPNVLRGMYTLTRLTMLTLYWIFLLRTALNCSA